MSLLSFVVLMSSLLFDRGIQASPKLQDVIKEGSKSYSEIERAIQKIRKDPTSSPERTIFKNIDIKFNSVEIRDVIGHLISHDGNSIKYDSNVQTTDKLFTFIGDGHRDTPTIEMSASYIDSTKAQRFSKRFHFFPIASTADVRIPYYHESNVGQNLKKIRVRPMRSRANSLSNQEIYFAYTDPAEIKDVGGIKSFFSDLNSPDKDDFEYIGEAIDGPDKNNKVSGDIVVKSYASSKQEYLDSIDKSFSSSAFTLNKNGHIGKELSTLSNENLNHGRAVHLIGLPYTNNLIGFYDYNLLIAPSTSKKNEYYSLYNPLAAQKTKFKYSDSSGSSGSNAVIRQDPSEPKLFEVQWKSRDVRNIIGVSSAASKLEVEKAVLPKIKAKHDDDTGSTEIELALGRKAHGASVYHPAVSFANFKMESSKSYTFFVKFNMEKVSDTGSIYEASATSPIALIHSDWNLDSGQSASSDGGFVIYADKDGNLFFNSIPEDRNLNYNLKTSAGLYKDISGALKFDKLKYNLAGSKRDSRENFYILAFNIKPLSANRSRVRMYALENVKKNMGGVDIVATKVKEVADFEIDEIKSNSVIKFGGLIEVGNDSRSVVNLVDPLGGKGVIEISDMILYDEDLSAKSYGTSNYLELTMEYLYRKYLTENERKAGKYDEYFMSKY